MKRAMALVLAATTVCSQAGTTYDGPWPPYSKEQCISAAASGYLTKQGMDYLECSDLVDAEGKPSAAEDAFNNGYFLTDVGIWEVDSAGGVEPYIYVVNAKKTETLKYLTLTVRFFNAVGDVVSSEIGGYRSFSIEFTGPLKNQDGPQKAVWEPVAYANTADCMHVDSVKVTFMSGKSEKFSGKNLHNAFKPGVKFRCK